MGLLAVVMFMPTQDGIFYSCILENIKFLFAKKVYTENADKQKERVDALLNLKDIKENGLIEYSNLNILGLGHERYQGNIYGAGISYGYQWILNKHWSMEAEIGVGYARIDYDKYNCGKCGSKLDSGHKNYIGPTKVALNIIYVIK